MLSHVARPLTFDDIVFEAGCTVSAAVEGDNVDGNTVADITNLDREHAEMPIEGIMMANEEEVGLRKHAGNSNEHDHIQMTTCSSNGEDEGEDDLERESLGDIFVCPEVILRDAEMDGTTLELRLPVVLVHGFSHLLGYTHHDNASTQAM